MAAATAAWLTEQGWQVRTEVEHVDVLAEREGVRLFAEAKGITSAPGLDVDTAYGQLLRRMPDVVPERVRYALVVPEETKRAALRVPPASGSCSGSMSSPSARTVGSPNTDSTVGGRRPGLFVGERPATPAAGCGRLAPA